MKLKDYMEHLNRIIKEKPEIKEHELVYAGDDEGNNFQPVHYFPAIGYFKNNEFMNTTTNTNSVCIN